MALVCIIVFIKQTLCFTNAIQVRCSQNFKSNIAIAKFKGDKMKQNTILFLTVNIARL